MNFTEQPVEASSIYPEPTFRRLQQVKASYDPEDILRANFPVSLAS